jgi:hypothetical protein
LQPLGFPGTNAESSANDCLDSTGTDKMKGRRPSNWCSGAVFYGQG